MAATVLIQDDAFELLGDGTPVGERQTLDAAALTHLQGLAARYALLEQRPDPAETHAIGRDLYRWIDGDQHQLGRLIEQAERPLLLTIHCPSRNPSPVEWALLHLSCHGHHAWRDNPKQDPRPVLMLEDGAFGQRPTDAVELLRALRQQSAVEAQGQFKDPADLAARETELPRARAAARGNPGLLDLLIARLLLNPAVPFSDAESALTEMEHYLTGGDLPASEPVRELLENIAVDTLLGLAGEAGKGLLQALTLFELPVPRVVVEQLARAVGGKVQRPIDLALVEPGEDPVHRTEVAINISPLAAARLAPLDAKERAPIAGIVIRPLFAAAARVIGAARARRQRRRPAGKGSRRPRPGGGAGRRGPGAGAATAGRRRHARHKAIDPVAVAAMILSIPSAMLAVADLADRIAKRRRANPHRAPGGGHDHHRRREPGAGGPGPGRAVGAGGEEMSVHGRF